MIAQSQIAHCSLRAGYCTCIAAMPEPLQTPTPAPAQTPTLSSFLSTYKQPGSAIWQMLTGHRSGHLKLWQASHQEPFQALAVIRAARSSPVQSLVVLPDLHLICLGHRDGHIVLYLTPEPSSAHQCIPAYQSEGSLPALALPTAAFQAHKSGLRQCVAGDTGLVSLGALGSIMVWPKSELQAVLNTAGLIASGRYPSCNLTACRDAWERQDWPCSCLAHHGSRALVSLSVLLPLPCVVSKAHRSPDAAFLPNLQQTPQLLPIIAPSLILVWKDKTCLHAPSFHHELQSIYTIIMVIVIIIRLSIVTITAVTIMIIVLL